MAVKPGDVGTQYAIDRRKVATDWDAAIRLPCDRRNQAAGKARASGPSVHKRCAPNLTPSRFEQPIEPIARRWIDENGFVGPVVVGGFRCGYPVRRVEIGILLRIPTRGGGRPGNQSGVRAREGDREPGRVRRLNGDERPKPAIE